MPSPFDDAGLPELSLAGLDQSASNALLDLGATTLPADVRRRILEEADGNPLALIELPVAAAELGSQAARSEPLPLTDRLEQAFASRLTNLGTDVQELLLLAALDEVDLAELSRAAGRPVEPDDLTPAVAAGLGTLESGRFRFRHPLIRSAVQQAATAAELRHAHAALAEALADEPDRAVWHRAAAASGPSEVIAVALDAAADRAVLRGGGDVAVAAYERAAELTADPRRRAMRLFLAGDLALELGGPKRGVRLLRTAQQIGLPPAEHAIASFYLELAESTWSGSATIRDFARIARELVAGGEGRKALRALATVSVRAYWERLDDGTRQEIAAISDEIAGPADDPLRLHILAMIDPVGRGKQVVEQVSRRSPVGISDPDDLFVVGAAAQSVWADTRAIPFLQAAAAGARADGRLSLLAHTLVFQAWADLHRGAVRRAITSAAEGVRIAEEIRALRYVVAARLAQAIAGAEQGDDETSERLIADAETLLIPLGANPMLALPALARGRLALARERFGEAYEHLVRIFDPAGAAFHPFVRGWALADLADAAVRGDGDLTLSGVISPSGSRSRPPRRRPICGPACVCGGHPRPGRGRGRALSGRDRDGAGGVAVLRCPRAARLRRLAAPASTDDAVSRAAPRGGARRSTLSACCGSQSGPAGSCGPPARRSAAAIRGPGLSCRPRSSRSPSSRPRASRTGRSASSSISRTGPSSRTSTGSSRSSASPPARSCGTRWRALRAS